MDKKSLFTKSSDGRIFLKGSGDYYRTKKIQFLDSDNSYNQMYRDQLYQILKIKISTIIKN
jgi:hypothetical protein